MAYIILNDHSHLRQLHTPSLNSWGHVPDLDSQSRPELKDITPIRLTRVKKKKDDLPFLNLLIYNLD